MMFGTVLIANRGEIALRVARTCRELGIRTVAVHSAADAPPDWADQTIRIGPAPARRSYLNAAALIEAALQSGADAVHPGYGFLSEDAEFARICEEYGLTFIGPSADVIEAMGDKAAARATMSAAGVPVLPGSLHAVEEEEGRRLADEVGYPVVIKAVAGGGGRGMAIVHSGAGFSDSYRRVRAEAQLLFGDDRVCLERYLRAAHHVEIQVICDAHGNAVHLGERDCSTQRRRQKLLEESPSPAIAPELAERMAQAALAGARAIGYRGLGTFEFLVDDDTGDYFFIETNCRIQVEHPVTELVTGLDLVSEQLAVASGLPLPFRQEDVVRRGAALECRINAEDPERNFAPAPGLIEEFTPPGGPFVRVDTHVRAGTRIPPDYDPMIAKIVTWGADRDQAIDRMDRALSELRVSGPGLRTNTAFLREVLATPVFRKGAHTTGFIDHLTKGET
ncbi:acetyl-CoA carboxylase biotin carboxylase subunit [Nonomuraea endophytica]|uniref:biotin carboxylase n=1 Tax=Nonomuraea endophytica TaxID=714136 RepID=A0A7W8A6B0_9ACTN|nr:biotin carboxylase N-terminal domain-containing protein [Nonomuraea endophytica]MBB5080416.1 acetyl-CoA carboxylase biotin carboxylase subunit [Nonomuraea endophytica]